MGGMNRSCRDQLIEQISMNAEQNGSGGGHRRLIWGGFACGSDSLRVSLGG